MRICWVTQCPLQTGHCLSPKTLTLLSCLDFVFVWDFCFALHLLKNKFDWLRRSDIDLFLLILHHNVCLWIHTYYQFPETCQIWFYTSPYADDNIMMLFTQQCKCLLSIFHHIWCVSDSHLATSFDSLECGKCWKSISTVNAIIIC